MPSADRGSRREAPVNLRRLGRTRILQALFDAGELARPELIQRTGLSPATVTSVIDDLIGEDLVCRAAAASPEARLGRPPLTFGLRPEAGYAFGVDIGHDHVRTILCDLRGDRVWEDSASMDVDDLSGESLATAAAAIDRALRTTKTPRSAVFGVGLGIACPVERDTGRLRAQGIMPAWVGLAPGEELAARTGLAVRVINDANACVLAERRYGAARGCADVVYLRLSSGIGAGVVSDGRTLLGRDGLAGELGHITVDPAGAVCRCGSRGCLETVASPTAIAALLSRSWHRQVGTAELIELVAAGDRGAVRVVEDAGEAVGRTLATTVMTLDPALIVIGGELAAVGEVLLDPVRRALRRHAVAAQQGTPEVVTGTLGDTAGARGAAALILTDAPLLLAEPQPAS